MTARIPTPEERRELAAFVKIGVELFGTTTHPIATDQVLGLLAAADERDELAERLEVADAALAAVAFATAEGWQPFDVEKSHRICMSALSQLRGEPEVKP